MVNKPANRSMVSGNIRNHKDSSILAGSLLVSVVVLYFLVGPLYTEMRVTSAKNAARSAELSDSQQLLADIKDFNRNTDSTLASSRKLAAFIPSRDNSQELFMHIKSLAQYGNLEVAGFKVAELRPQEEAVPAEEVPDPADSAANPYTETKTFKLNEREAFFEMKGDYDNLMAFAKSLENGIPFIQETSIQIGSDLDVSPESQALTTGAPVMLTAMINFKYYYY